MRAERELAHRDPRGWVGLLRRLRRYAAYVWAAPNTLLGILFVLLFSWGGIRWRRTGGALEVCGPGATRALRCLTWPIGCAAALTLGHVVVGQDDDCLRRTRAHERVHVRQYERWGPAFLPAYLASSLWAAVRGRDPYRDNWFEREAYAQAPLEEPSSSALA